MKGDALPNTDHVSRYCKPSAIQDGRVMPNAFLFRNGEDHLSVNWLEYLMAPDLDSAVDMVRKTFRQKGFEIKYRGLFVVLNVGDVKNAIHSVIEKAPRVEHLPLDNDASHAGISGYSAAELIAAQDGHITDGDDAEYYATIEADAADRIAMLLNRNCTYPGVVGGDQQDQPRH